MESHKNGIYIYLFLYVYTHLFIHTCQYMYTCFYLFTVKKTQMVLKRKVGGILCLLSYNAIWMMLRYVRTVRTCICIHGFMFIYIRVYSYKHLYSYENIYMGYLVPPIAQRYMDDAKV
jgi:hypothetical protein